MILQLELPVDVEARLTREARQHNLSLEDYALNKLLALPEPEPPHAETAGESILRLTEEIFGNMPEEERRKMPPDFAVNHDHYLYGAPKVQE